MTAVQRTDLESLATALLQRVDGLVESNAKLQSEVHSAGRLASGPSSS